MRGLLQGGRIVALSLAACLGSLCGQGVEAKPEETAPFQEAEGNWKKGDLNAALWNYRKSLTQPMSDDQKVFALTRIAMLQMQMGKQEEGMAAYGAIVEKYPEHAMAPHALLFQANFALLEKNQLTKGIALYEKLIKRYPKSPAAAQASQWLPELRKITPVALQAMNQTRRKQEAAALQKLNDKKQKSAAPRT